MSREGLASDERADQRRGVVHVADKSPKGSGNRGRTPSNRFLTPEEEAEAAAELERRKEQIEARVRADRDTIVATTDAAPAEVLTPEDIGAKLIDDRLTLIRATQRADADTADAPKEGTPGEAAASAQQQRQAILDRLADGGIVVRPVIGAEPLSNADIADLVDTLAERELVAEVTGTPAAEVRDDAFANLISDGDRKAVEDVLTINLDDLTPVGQIIVAGQVRSGGPASSHFENLLDDIVGGTNTTGFFKPGVIPGFGQGPTGTTTTGTGTGTGGGTGTGTAPAPSGDSGSGTGGADGNAQPDEFGDDGFGDVPGSEPDDGGGVTGGSDGPEVAPPDGGGGEGPGESDDVTGGSDGGPDDAPPDGGEGDGDQGGSGDATGGADDEFPASDEDIDVVVDDEEVEDDFFEDDEDDDEDDDSGGEPAEAGGGTEVPKDPDAGGSRPKGDLDFGGFDRVLGGLTGGGDVDPAEDDGTSGGTPITGARPRGPDVVNPISPDPVQPLPANPVRLKDPGNIDPTDDDAAFGAGAGGRTGQIPTGPSVATPVGGFDSEADVAPSFGAREPGIESGLTSDFEFGETGPDGDDDDDLNDD